MDVQATVSPPVGQAPMGWPVSWPVMPPPGYPPSLPPTPTPPRQKPAEEDLRSGWYYFFQRVDCSRWHCTLEKETVTRTRQYQVLDVETGQIRTRTRNVECTCVYRCTSGKKSQTRTTMGGPCPCRRDYDAGPYHAPTHSSARRG